jgi:hypothetical protein
VSFLITCFLHFPDFDDNTFLKQITTITSSFSYLKDDDNHQHGRRRTLVKQQEQQQYKNSINTENNDEKMKEELEEEQQQCTIEQRIYCMTRSFLDSINLIPAP